MKDAQDFGRRRESRLLSAARTALARTWLGFSVSAFVTAAASSVLEHDSPLKSDDPYIVGGIVAAFCAGFAFISSIAGAIAGSGAKQPLAYFGTLFALSAFLIGVDVVCTMPEGQGIPSFFGVAIAVIGATVYSLMKIPVTKWYVVVGSVPGLLYLLGYCRAIHDELARLLAWGL